MKALMVVVLVALAGCQGDVMLRGGIGEYKNIEDTAKAVLEVREGKHEEGLYSYTHITTSDHPSEYVESFMALQGVGWKKGDWLVEAAIDDTSYLGNLTYNQDVLFGSTNGDVWGTLTHYDKWDTPNSRTYVTVGVGVEVVEDWSLGAWYEVGNVGAHHTNDVYGAYLRHTY